MNTCFLLLIRAFHKNTSIKRSKEKRGISPKFNRFMPKTSEIALKNEKRTDVFGINPIVSICLETQHLIQFRTPS